MHIPSSFLSQPKPHSLRVFGSDWKAIHHAVLDAMTLTKRTPLLWPASEVTDLAKMQVVVGPFNELRCLCSVASDPAIARRASGVSVWLTDLANSAESSV
jgi:hypothetical protein